MAALVVVLPHLCLWIYAYIFGIFYQMEFHGGWQTVRIVT